MGSAAGAARVTVVVPVHDDRAGMVRCLRHLAAQDYPSDRLQVLVCDNASSTRLDTTVFDDVPTLPARLLHEPVPGSYRARNRCLEVADGEVIAFTDADCSPRSNWVSEGVAAMATTGADLVAGRVAVYATSDHPGPIELYDCVTAFPQEKYVRSMGFGVTANLFVASRVFDDVGTFDADLSSGGDREFCERARGKGHRLEYSDSAVVEHPARSSYREVRAKIRRVRRGAYEERRQALPVRTVLRRALPPLGAGCRAARSYRAPLLRFKYVLGELAVHYTIFVTELGYVLPRVFRRRTAVASGLARQR